MNAFSEIMRLFPKPVAESIIRTKIIPEEIRIRRGQAITLRSAEKEVVCDYGAITQREITHLVMNATNGGYHGIQAYLEQGYLPLSYGGRMGLTGEGAGNCIRSVQSIVSLCIRIPQEVYGCGDAVFKKIMESAYQNMIIIAPPGAGKTTLLRELIRRLSQSGKYIGVADERGEISGMTNGESGFDLGPRSDVLVGIKKQEAAMMLLRTMSPDILAMDEITAASDANAILETIGAGVGLLTTLHGSGTEALKSPRFRTVYESKAFEKAVLIRREKGQREYSVVNIYE